MDSVFAIIVGAGASGLASAIFLKRRFPSKNKRVVILERQKKCGKKLLATGGGRCNLSNKNINQSAYHGDRKLIDSVLEQFGVDDTIEFFKSIGMLVREDGAERIYPYSEKSATVLECLLDECQRLGVEIVTECAVEEIQPKKLGYIIKTNNGIYNSKNVVVSCGTNATTETGGTNNGFEWFNSLGIEYEPPRPALTPVFTVENPCLKGVRAKGTVSLKKNSGEVVARSNGEIQFMNNGLSGICVFDLSYLVSEFLKNKTINGKSCKQIFLAVDLFPTYTKEELFAFLMQRKELTTDNDRLLNGALEPNLAKYIIQRQCLNGKSTRNLTEQQIRNLADTAKNLLFTPKECSVKNAQVCAGGATAHAVNPQTLECRNHRGLYITGELLNVDGICGGYNLQWAWATAYAVARSITHLEYQ